MTKNNLTKNDIVKDLSHRTGFSINFSKKLINDLIEILKLNIIKGNFNYKNFGSFKIINKTQRVGRNPKTGEKFIIEARKNVSFKASGFLLKNIRKYYEKTY